MRALRELWRDLSQAHAAQLDRLQPLIALREADGDAGMELHLVAGPFADAALAQAMCATLGKAGHSDCLPVAFEGQRLMAETSSPMPAAAQARQTAPDAARESSVTKSSASVRASEAPAPSVSSSAQLTRPKIQTRVHSQPARQAVDSSTNPLERLFRFGR